MEANNKKTTFKVIFMDMMEDHFHKMTLDEFIKNGMESEPETHIAFNDPILDDLDKFIEHMRPLFPDADDEEFTNMFLDMRTERDKIRNGCGTKTGCSTNGNDIP